MAQPTLTDELHRYDIGAKLRALRLKKKLGLVELGRHTGLSPALLSKLERGKMFPTLQTLLRIAMVFSVDLDYFFADHRKHRAFAIVRRAARQRFPEAPGRREPAYHFESLTFPVAEPKCEAYVATFHPVADGKARPHQHAGVEMIYVLSGELGVTIESTEHRLEDGDAMYFDATVQHSYRRTGRNTCSALIVSVR
ncbi:MAG: XRE family transcriptional regulator [Vicinamibacterales bacterium]